MSGLGGMDPAGMLNQVMQMVQQMTQQQQGSDGTSQCGQGGGNDPTQMFQQVLQQLLQGGGQGKAYPASPTSHGWTAAATAVHSVWPLCRIVSSGPAMRVYRYNAQTDELISVKKLTDEVINRIAFLCGDTAAH